MPGRSTILKYLAERREAIGFWVGAALGFAAAIVANVVPYIQTYGAYGFDGVEIIGFPFVFRSFGGFSAAYKFSHLALSADIAFVLTVSVSVGFLTKRSISFLSRRRGFAWCAGPPQPHTPWQFTLRQLLLVVMLAALACAVDKYLAAVMNHWPPLIGPH